MMIDETTKKVELDPDDLSKDLFFGSPITEKAEAPQPVEKAPIGTEKGPASEEAPAAKETAPCAEAAPSEKPLSAELPLEEYTSVLDAHYQNLRALIKYTKTKDETIYKLNGELQKYREDYCAKSFKAIATLIISYREDCRKSLQDLSQFELTAEKAKKFMQFLSDDLEELLSNAGCEEDDGKWLFNGKPLSLCDEKTAVGFPKAFDKDVTVPDEDIAFTSAVTLREYVASSEKAIKTLLANNELVDKCLKEYASLFSVIEDDLVLVNVIPAVRRLVSVSLKTKAMVATAIEEINEENKKDKYGACLTFLVDALEDILLSGGVSIDSTCDDLFDTKRNRLVRAVPTEDASLDRKIAKQYTECYVMNDKIIYPAKVDVYKYQAPRA